jgi:hypothetical protein
MLLTLGLQATKEEKLKDKKFLNLKLKNSEEHHRSIIIKHSS